MKKKLLVLLLILLSVIGYSQKNSSIGIHTGHSWINGLIGAEYQYSRFAFSAGFFPTTMPISNKNVTSFSSAFTIYSHMWNEPSFYASFGVASAGYRTETITMPMNVVMLGLKHCENNVSIKTGLGYMWCEEEKRVTVEITVNFTFKLKINP